MSMPKSIAVIGAGHVGAPHAVILAKKVPTVKVTVVDDDARKVALWNSSQLPFYEPSLQEAVEEARGANLSFTTDMASAIAGADMIFVSVSTPLKDDGVGAGYAPDLQYWEKIARLIAQSTPTPKVIVERSTVPVKTAELMSSILSANTGGKKWTVLSNPEFAREGHAMLDHASPERVMIGAPPTAEGAAAAAALKSLYTKWVPDDKVIISGLWSAELSKMTANAFLAQRISSINAISALCEKTGADVSEVAHSIGYDSRIGRKSIEASIGFGGACYETHLRNLIYLCKHYRLPPVAAYWESVLNMNNWQKRRFAARVVSSMFNTVSGKKLAVFGFAYKKNTSDIRNTPSIDICRALLAEKAHLVIHDPRVTEQAMSVALTGDDGEPASIACEEDPLVAASGAHAILILTEWDVFKRLDYRAIYESMSRPAFIFDGRNLLDHDELREIGFQVHGIGKPPPARDPTADELEAADRDATAQEARMLAGATPRTQYGNKIGLSDDMVAAPPDAPAVPGAPPAPPSLKHRTETFGSLA